MNHSYEMAKGFVFVKVTFEAFSVDFNGFIFFGSPTNHKSNMIVQMTMSENISLLQLVL